MGRKSSSKAQTRAASGTPAGTPPDPPKRVASPVLIVAVVAIAAIAGIFVAMRANDATAPSAAQTAASAATQPPVDAVPAAAKFGPHKQDRLPPLPVDPMPARPPDVVRAAYLFAAEHPEILAYVPCYCGCERSGHRGNDDCFVAARDAEGNVTQWEPHGAT
jgi:Protein of unknown function with PCYCGC motif